MPRTVLRRSSRSRGRRELALNVAQAALDRDHGALGLRRALGELVPLGVFAPARRAASTVGSTTVSSFDEFSGVLSSQQKGTLDPRSGHVPADASGVARRLLGLCVPVLANSGILRGSRGAQALRLGSVPFSAGDDEHGDRPGDEAGRRHAP